MTGRMTRQSHFLNDVLKEANQYKRQQKLRYANAVGDEYFAGGNTSG